MRARVIKKITFRNQNGVQRQHKMQRQFEILNRILELLEVEVNHDFQTLSCMFVPIGDDGERTAETTFFYKRNGTEINAGLSNENIFELVDLAVELQTKMKAHTGGEWSEFLFEVDESRKVGTKFQYPRSALST